MYTAFAAAMHARVRAACGGSCWRRRRGRRLRRRCCRVSRGAFIALGVGAAASSRCAVSRLLTRVLRRGAADRAAVGAGLPEGAHRRHPGRGRGHRRGRSSRARRAGARRHLARGHERGHRAPARRRGLHRARLRAARDRRRAGARGEGLRRTTPTCACWARWASFGLLAVPVRCCGSAGRWRATAMRAARDRVRPPDRASGWARATIALAISCAFGDRFFTILITGAFWMLCALVSDLVIERPRRRPA